MNVYAFEANGGEMWRSVSYIAGDGDVWDQFGRKPLMPTWVPLVVKTIDSDQDPEVDDGRPQYYGHLPIPDFPCNFGCRNVISRRAVNGLAEFFTGTCEVLPLRCSFGEYYAINCLAKVDVLDVERSTVKRFNNPPYRIWDIVRYAWKMDMLQNLSLFHIQQFQYEVYCTEPVVQRIRDAGLTGFRMKPLIGP